MTISGKSSITNLATILTSLLRPKCLKNSNAVHGKFLEQPRFLQYAYSQIHLNTYQLISVVSVFILIDTMSFNININTKNSLIKLFRGINKNVLGQQRDDRGWVLIHTRQCFCWNVAVSFGKEAQEILYVNIGSNRVSEIVVVWLSASFSSKFETCYITIDSWSLWIKCYPSLPNRYTYFYPSILAYWDQPVMSYQDFPPQLLPSPHF